MKTVLLVDDDDSVLAVLELSLRRSIPELEICRASDGRQAVQVLEAQPVDLLVTDLKMPEMDGFQLLGWVSQHRPGLPAIVLTACPLDGVDAYAGKLPLVRCLSKPVDLSVFLREVRETLGFAARGRLAGIPLSGILQLLAIERQSCVLRVASRGREGMLQLTGGRLMSAATGDLRGEDAVYAILAWGAPEIEIADIGLGAPADASDIELPLARVLIEAMVRLDAQAREAAANDATELLPDESGPAADELPPGVRSALEEQAPRIRGALSLGLVDRVSGEMPFAWPSDLRQRDSAQRPDQELLDLLVAQCGLEPGERVDELIVSFERHVHVLRVPPDMTVWLWLVLDRGAANLAMARLQLSRLAELLVAAPTP